jgi:hypothetical protein
MSHKPHLFHCSHGRRTHTAATGDAVDTDIDSAQSPATSTNDTANVAIQAD